MNRKVLLVEPNYKNKYPPMGLMKLATYYRMVGDDVRFYKGDMRLLAVDLICEDLINHLSIIFPVVIPTLSNLGLVKYSLSLYFFRYSFSISSTSSSAKISSFSRTAYFPTLIKANKIG